LLDKKSSVKKISSQKSEKQDIPKFKVMFLALPSKKIFFSRGIHGMEKRKVQNIFVFFVKVIVFFVKLL